MLKYRKNTKYSIHMLYDGLYVVLPVKEELKKRSVECEET